MHVRYPSDIASYQPRENMCTTPRYEDEQGTNFNPYSSLANFEQHDTIGTGKFGCVHLVRNIVNNDFCVMKVLNKRDTIKMKQVEHTRNEKEVLALVRNQNFFTQLYATYSDENNLYMCLEFCPGGELFKLLREVGRFNQKTTAFYGAEIVLAFEFLHAKNIAYRDLKPENVLIGSDGHLKLCDFGFAKKIDDRSWTLCGTPEYLPPEIILGKGHDKSVDWWSFGVFLFELLAGYAPFHGPRPIDIYEKILAGVDSVIFPNFFSAESRDIIRRFLTSKSRRLGNVRGGIKEIKRHNFFMTINWDRVARQEVAPPAVPNLQGAGDRANFDIVTDAHPKFNIFGEDETDANMDMHVEDKRGPSRVPSSPPDLSVFNDWATTIFV
eukprot:TRINITY_DN4148_c0_g1_i1.p1 TRINITY_DN4148_c0_g1~~TRINITY_DN4148_c0_g1_i1.p1  ORF type:complete len:391 (+),score=69.89 TRINITY_DN4148_c0_g1_i1:29-1174(+)